VKQAREAAIGMIAPLTVFALALALELAQG
jgi:hypothetical protein